ncbi:hypothetical protein RJ639_026055 [Escallonia herrerae]|uniref:Uncharacterized protein n=1 Tax=Escallonia herrerae TaxID=1293975 RepID=A0AA88USM4_9ASTE|nr:hypothetical protein RJ639_026055 [Escallonia herrerae]
MGSSINAFSVFFHSSLHCPKLHARTPLNPTPTKLSFSLQIPPLNCHLLKHSTQPLDLFKPKSPTPNHSPQKQISKFFSEKITVVLLGSFLFMGGFNTRPILAQPVQESSYSENMEQKRDTQNGGCEHEDMYVRLLEENPKNVEALKVAFDAKMRRGKTKEAVEFVERLIDVEPKEVEWRLLQALCYEMLGQLSKAKRLFKDILKEKPLLLRALHV